MYLHGVRSLSKYSGSYMTRGSARHLGAYSVFTSVRSFTRSCNTQGSSAAIEATGAAAADVINPVCNGNQSLQESLKSAGNPFLQDIYDKPTTSPRTVSQRANAALQGVTYAASTPVLKESSSIVPASEADKVLVQKSAKETTVPSYQRGDLFIRDSYWQKVPRWSNWTEEQFFNTKLLTMEGVRGEKSLITFLNEVLPEKLPASEKLPHIRTRSDFVSEVEQAFKKVTMSIRLAPHILCSVDWDNPVDDPLRRQFIRLISEYQPDHPKFDPDSQRAPYLEAETFQNKQSHTNLLELHEKDDHPIFHGLCVDNIVHRYPDRVLFLATSICGHYCPFCTRAYAIGPGTESGSKDPYKSGKKYIDPAIEYIASNPAVADVVLSGGDSYLLEPHQLRNIGERLLDIPHIRRIRIATKGFCTTPSRTLDPNDTWTDELVELSNRGKAMGKEVYMHTHINHPNEISWVTREAAQKLFQRGVKVRNQTVLLRGVNDTLSVMKKLIRELIDNHIDPYYVYQCDMIKGVEDMRTPLSTVNYLQKHIRGTIAGYAMPQFIVDLPGGGGKRLANDFESYNPATGLSTWTAPGVKDGKTVYEYWDPKPYVQE